MTYPLSSAVAIGDATEAAQYNNLRKDALYLGNEPDESGTIRDLLGRSLGDIRLSRNSNTTVLLAASALRPAAVGIDGVIYAVSENQTMTVSSALLPDAGRYSIYAAGSSDGSFGITADSSTLPDASRIIGTFLWDGAGIIPGTVRTMTEYEMISATCFPGLPSGRLTLNYEKPISGTEVEESGTIYFVPFNGNRIGLYLYGGWEYFSFSELSLSVNGLRTGLPYDVFLSADVNGLQLTASAWASVSSRATGSLRWIDGVRVNSQDTGKRYLGSFALDSDGLAADRADARLLWNENNRAVRTLSVPLVTNQNEGRLESTGTWEPYFGADAPAVQVLLPVEDAELDLEGIGKGNPITSADLSYYRAYAIGICRDMNTVSPYSGNETAIPVYMASQGNGELRVRMHNSDSGNVGLHTYTLAFWSNYTYRCHRNLAGETIPGGMTPGLYGFIKG